MFSICCLVICDQWRFWLGLVLWDFVFSTQEQVSSELVGLCTRVIHPKHGFNSLKTTSGVFGEVSGQVQFLKRKFSKICRSDGSILFAKFSQRFLRFSGDDQDLIGSANRKRPRKLSLNLRGYGGYQVYPKE